MNKSIAENLNAAMQKAISIRPKIGGFPHLAKTLKEAGVKKNLWFLPSCQSIYLTDYGPVVVQGSPLFIGTKEVFPFDKESLIRALRIDQAGKGTFAEFLESSWKAGVIRYEVDFENRNVSYYGCFNEEYVEEYPAV